MERQEWTKEEADSVYHISKWGDGHFDINNDGLLTINPAKDGKAIPIKKSY